MLSEIRLYGFLAEKYGNKHRFDIVNVSQAVNALAANFKGFYKDFKDGWYNILVGGEHFDEEKLKLRTSGKTIHFIPVIAGSKSSGTSKAIAGIAILAIATGGAALAVGPFAAGTSAFSATAFSVGSASVSYGTLALAGVSLALSGVSTMLTPVPKAEYNTREKADQRASFLFNGATNRSTVGSPIPLVYGRYKVGSIVASAGITIEQIS